MRCSIFDSELSDRYQPDWTMGVHWGLPYFQQILSDSVWRGLKESQNKSFSVLQGSSTILPIYNAATGENIVNASILKNIRLTKNRLHSFLAKGINIEVVAFSTLERT